MSQNNPYEEMIQNMPAGLDRAILRIVDFHRGKSAAIGGEELTRQVGMSGFHIDHRTVREMIKALRRKKHLICSTPGTDGGYYLATDLAEYEEFKMREYQAKILDMSETVRFMDQAAMEQFGQGVQLRLV